MISTLPDNSTLRCPSCPANKFITVITVIIVIIVIVVIVVIVIIMTFKISHLKAKVDESSLKL